MEDRPTYGNRKPSEKTFEELISDECYEMILGGEKTDMITSEDALKILKQVREATIAEAVEFCVSRDWIKTIDNLKRLPTDRIYQFENKRE